MKICQLAFPALAWSQDDTSTLLSMKMQVHSTLEAGVDQLLESVGSRNVTQMSALIESLVEETIKDDASPYAMEGEVKTALDMIKHELVGDIRGALNDAHCHDQLELHQRFLDFEQCETKYEKGKKDCVGFCDGSKHKICRDGLLIKYKSHIEKCRALDSWVYEFVHTKCPRHDKECCLLSHTTWNCPLCASKIAHASVSNTYGEWIDSQIYVFTEAYNTWTTLHTECKKSYQAYIEKDAECDCAQADCEATNCVHEGCHFMNCEHTYQKCLEAANIEWDRTVKHKECLEKDRKIDWSATEKIECFVNVLLERPTPEQLKAECGTPDCFNEYRTRMYHKCHTICTEVDFVNADGKIRNHVRREYIHGDHRNWTAEDMVKNASGHWATEEGEQNAIKDQSSHQWEDIDVTGEGKEHVRTKHRSKDGKGEKRCTSHLDLDYQEKPCCTACEQRRKPPCTGDLSSCGKEDPLSYMWMHYGQYKHCSLEQIDDFTAEKCYKEADQEHTWAYAYNLCECKECADNGDPYALQCGEVLRECRPGETNKWREHDAKPGACRGEAIAYDLSESKE